MTVTSGRNETFVVTIEALPDDAPATIRLRRWLKTGYRWLRLRCVSITPAIDPPAEDSEKK